MTAVTSTDPRTGRVVATVAEETAAAEVTELGRRAAAAAPRLERLGRPFRAGVLRALADALDADRAAIVEVADRETALGPTRLNGELTRTCYQLRRFADVVEEGGYLEATIDHATDDAGTAMVRHPAVKAVGFTGSLHGGRALADLAAARPEPIPFYGELSSLNPVVVTPAAAAERAEAIGKGLAGSATLGAGQFCTKPGLVFVPVGPDGDRLRDAVAKAFGELDAQVALNRGIQASYRQGTNRLAEHPGLTVLAAAGDDTGDGFLVRPMVFTTDTRRLDEVVIGECFGPTTILVSYSDDADLLSALRGLPGSLTATLHVAQDTADDVGAVLDVVRHKAGRILFNGFPTGVAVAWAQQHGGPWPSTNTLHTSVGLTAIRRFLRPLAWQDAPASALPAELRDDPGGAAVPRRVDGAPHLA